MDTYHLLHQPQTHQHQLELQQHAHPHAHHQVLGTSGGLSLINTVDNAIVSSAPAPSVVIGGGDFVVDSSGSSAPSSNYYVQLDPNSGQLELVGDGGVFALTTSATHSPGVLNNHGLSGGGQIILSKQDEDQLFLRQAPTDLDLDSLAASLSTSTTAIPAGLDYFGGGGGGTTFLTTTEQQQPQQLQLQMQVPTATAMQFLQQQPQQQISIPQDDMEGLLMDGVLSRFLGTGGASVQPAGGTYQIQTPQAQTSSTTTEGISPAVMSIVASMLSPGATAFQVDNHILICHPSGQVVDIPLTQQQQQIPTPTMFTVTATQATPTITTTDSAPPSPLTVVLTPSQLIQAQAQAQVGTAKATVVSVAPTTTTITTPTKIIASPQKKTVLSPSKTVITSASPSPIKIRATTSPAPRPILPLSSVSVVRRPLLPSPVKTTTTTTVISSPKGMRTIAPQPLVTRTPAIMRPRGSSVATTVIVRGGRAPNPLATTITSNNPNSISPQQRMRLPSSPSQLLRPQNQIQKPNASIILSAVPTSNNTTPRPFTSSVKTINNVTTSKPMTASALAIENMKRLVTRKPIPNLTPISALTSLPSTSRIGGPPQKRMKMSMMSTASTAPTTASALYKSMTTAAQNVNLNLQADPEEEEEEFEEPDFDIRIVSCYSIKKDGEDVSLESEGETILTDSEGEKVASSAEGQVPTTEKEDESSSSKMDIEESKVVVEEVKSPPPPVVVSTVTIPKPKPKRFIRLPPFQEPPTSKKPNIPIWLAGYVDKDDELLIAFKNRTDPMKTDLCGFCYSWFDSTEELAAHTAKAHDYHQADHVCTVCGDRFIARVLRLRHEKLHKYDLKYRPIVYLMQPDLKSHFTKRFRPAPFSPWYRGYLNHLLQNLIDLPFDCYFCDSSFSSSDDVLEHCNQVHFSQACGFCGQREENMGALQKHEREFHGHYPLTKNVEGGAWRLWSEDGEGCEEMSVKPTILSNIAYFHNYAKMGGEEEGAKKPYEEEFVERNLHEEVDQEGLELDGGTLCLEDGSMYTLYDITDRPWTPPNSTPTLIVSNFCEGEISPETKARVASIASTLRVSQLPYPCPHCTKSYDSEHDLKRHARCHRNAEKAKSSSTASSPSKPNLACKYCGRTFTTHSHKKEHERIHTGEKPYTCHICQKSFIQSSNLKKHILTHQHASLQCTTCGKQFVKEASLVLHQRAHAQDRKFRCGVCDRAYNYASLLKRHMRIHTGEMPYSCDSCGMLFHELVSLHYHRKKIHTGERPHKCETCGRAFILSSDLKKHVQIHFKPKDESQRPASAGSRKRSQSRSTDLSSTENSSYPPSPASVISTTPNQTPSSTPASTPIRRANSIASILNSNKEVEVSVISSPAMSLSEENSLEGDVIEKEEGGDEEEDDEMFQMFQQKQQEPASVVEISKMSQLAQVASSQRFLLPPSSSSPSPSPTSSPRTTTTNARPVLRVYTRKESPKKTSVVEVGGQESIKEEEQANGMDDNVHHHHGHIVDPESDLFEMMDQDDDDDEEGRGGEGTIQFLPPHHHHHRHTTMIPEDAALLLGINSQNADQLYATELQEDVNMMMTTSSSTSSSVLPPPRASSAEDKNNLLMLNQVEEAYVAAFGENMNMMDVDGFDDMASLVPTERHQDG